MSKIVFFCIPAHGHTNPTLGVVRELVLRGHQVWYYSYNFLREKIEETGATFVSCDAYDMEQRLTPKDTVRLGKDLAFSTKILVDTTLALDDVVCAHMEQLKPDCIVADSMALWGKAVALKLGIPFVSSTTTFAFNRHSAKVMKQGLGDLIRMLFSMRAILKQIKRLQDKGYPIDNVLDIIGADERAHTVVYTSPEFQPFSETFPDTFAFVGPCVRPAKCVIEKTGKRLVYISMGTVNNDMLSFYRQCIAAFADADYQVILSVGASVAVADLGDLSENVLVFSFTDQIAVLKEADVFVSHCGMNSVSESLYFEVPLVMLPQTKEQQGVAARVAELGAGIGLGRADAQSILRAVNQICDDGKYRQNAKQIAEGFAQCPGAKGAADKILQVCRKA